MVSSKTNSRPCAHDERDATANGGEALGCIQVDAGRTSAVAAGSAVGIDRLIGLPMNRCHESASLKPSCCSTAGRW